MSTPLPSRLRLGLTRSPAFSLPRVGLALPHGRGSVKSVQNQISLALLLCLRNNLFVAPTSALFHNRIAVLRAERGLSRQSVAEAIGVNYQTIGYIERGDYFPSLDLAFRLSELFGVPIEMIFARRPFEPMDRNHSSKGD